MPFTAENIRLLKELGFTENEATLYLELLKNGKTDAKKLSEYLKMGRTATYRILDELQKKGMVEKEPTIPLKFKAVLPSIGLQNAITQKSEELKRIEKETQELISDYKYGEEEADQSDFMIKILDGRRRIIRLIQAQHDNVEITADIITVLPRFLHILNYCFDNFESAVRRGVKYRIIVGTPDPKISLPSNLLSVVKRPNVEMETVPIKPNVNLAIFDGKEATLGYYVSKSIAESPIILTNHPGFLLMSQSYFETTWNEIKSCSFSPLKKIS